MKKIFAITTLGLLAIVGLPQRAASPAHASSYVPTFTNQTGNSSNSTFYGVAYGAGTWVKVMSSTPYYSTDGGNNWTAGTTTVTAGSFQDVEYLNGRFFALCESSCTAGKQIQYSGDGINWSAANVPTTNIPVADADWGDIAYGNGILVAVGSGNVDGLPSANRVLRSTDNGATWTSQQFPTIVGSWPVNYESANAIVYSNGTFVASGSKTMTSTDGITWTVRNNTGLYDIAAGNGVLLGVSYVGNGSNHLYRSTNNGVSWSAVSHPSLGSGTQYVHRIRFGNGVFLFGSSTKFVTTANGSALSAATNWLATGSGQWRGLGFGAGRFVAVGDTSNGGASRTIASNDVADTSAPTIIGFSPNHQDSGTDPSSNIVLTFSESVLPDLSGRLVRIKRSSDDSTVDEFLADSATISYSGSTMTINPSTDMPPLTQIYVMVAAGAVTDLAGNSFAGITNSSTYSFTTGADVTAPLAPYAPDLTTATDTGSSSSDNITKHATPAFTVRTREAGGTVTVTASRAGASDVTCTMAGSTSGSSCSFQSIGEGTWSIVATHADASNNVSSSSSSLSVVIDRTGPALSSSQPVSNATGVAISDDIVMTFSESVVPGTGSFSLSKGSTCGTAVQSVTVSSSLISGTAVTINPSSDLDYLTRYCLTYPAGVVRDAAGNDSDAMTLISSGNVDFTTVSSDQIPPTASITEPSSPSSSRTLMYLVTFSESVSGLTSGDFSNLGTATCSFAVPTATATTFSVTATCTTDGTVVLRLAVNSVVDAAANTGPTAVVTATSVTINSATSVSTPVDTVAPTTDSIPAVGTGIEATVATTVPVASATTIPELRRNAAIISRIAPTTTTVPPTTTTTLPAREVPNVSDGGGALLIDGERIEATIARENNQLLISVGELRARISAVKREGGRIPLDSQGRIRMDQGDSIEIEVTGFGRSSIVEVRMYSDPVLLGKTSVSPLGALAASYEVPDIVEDGRHRVVLFGESQEKEELTFALSVYVGNESSGPSTLAILVAVPLGIAIIGGLIIPAILRRRREESAA